MFASCFTLRLLVLVVGNLTMWLKCSAAKPAPCGKSADGKPVLLECPAAEPGSLVG